MKNTRAKQFNELDAPAMMIHILVLGQGQEIILVSLLHRYILNTLILQKLKNS